MLEVRLLGQFAVRRDGTAIVIPSRAAQSLFAYLIVTAGTAHRREKLAGFLWPDTTDENARSNLRHELWRLRKAIEGKTSGRDHVSYLLVDEISIEFNAASDHWLDVAAVLSRTASTTSADTLTKQVSEYGGDLLPGFYDEWVLVERERIRGVYEQKMEHLLGILIKEERWKDVIDWGERWAAFGQTHEPACRALMIAYHARGDRGRVGRTFQRCADRLRDELGVEPSIETRELFERLSRDEQPAASRPKTELLAGPGVHTWSGRYTSLPIPLTSFIGREREVEEVERLLSKVRLLTLTGAGGVGKTRLAIRVAGELMSQYPDGVWWVDLAPLNDPALVPQMVAHELGLREMPNAQIAGALVERLGARQLLLVLDNCEHLIAACASLAESLLSSCASLTILATSREALGIAGEAIWHVPSLSFPAGDVLRPEELPAYESARLFVERARARKPEFAVTAQTVQPILHICRRLDGIPLAIELAAARINSLAVAQIAERIDNRFVLLTAGSRTALLRHQTLRATIDWSFDLLSDPERVLFRRLAVFAGGWTLEAAEAVGAGDELEPGQVLDLLSRLAGKSLVVAEEREGASRYRMLETIRQYANEKLAASREAGPLRDRHLRYYAGFAGATEGKLYGTDQLLWFSRLEAEIDNFRAAIEWTTGNANEETAPSGSNRIQEGLGLGGALWNFFFVRGHQREGTELLARLLTSQGADRRTIARDRALSAAGFLEWSLNDLDRACGLLEEALAISREREDRLGTARALDFLGMTSIAREDYDAAQTYLEECVETAAGLGDAGKFLSGESLLFLGDVPAHAGDDRGAQRLFEKSAAIMKELGNDDFRAYGVRRLGYIALHEGDDARALDLFRESLSLNEAVMNPTGVLACLASIAAVCVVRGQDHDAVRLYSAVSALLKTYRMQLLASDAPEYDRYLAQVRARVDPGAFAEYWETGATLEYEQAIAYARSVPAAGSPYGTILDSLPSRADVTRPSSQP